MFVVPGCGDDDDSNPANPGGGGTGADLTITINGTGANAYSPNPANITAGQTVSWRNVDSTPHTATETAGGFNTGNIGSGVTTTPIQMNTAGNIPYHCTIHGAGMMSGTLVVAP
jgi:plastocyanin